MKTACRLIVHGRSQVWSFRVSEDPSHLAEWQADGLDIQPLLNTIPVPVHRLGLTKPWGWAQDAINFLRLW
jgi:hypothetical protein